MKEPEDSHTTEKIMFTLLSFILLSAILFLGSVIFNKFDAQSSAFDSLIDVECSNTFLVGASDYLDLQQLCHNPECEEYFEDKIKSMIKFAEECFDE